MVFGSKNDGRPGGRIDPTMLRRSLVMPAYVRAMFPLLKVPFGDSCLLISGSPCFSVVRTARDRATDVDDGRLL